MALPTLTALIALLEEHYVIQERVPQITAALLADHHLTELDPPASVAAELTRRLSDSSGDLHLRVRTRSATPNTEAQEDFHVRMEREARANAGGIKAVTRLDAHTALITIAPYLSEVYLSAGYLDAAFALVADARRLIIDVRAGTGWDTVHGRVRLRIPARR